MSETFSIRAHFDGKTIVPDEPVDLPHGSALVVDIRPDHTEPSIPNIPALLAAQSAEDRIAVITELAKSMQSLPEVPLEALRRINMYADDTF